jgi:hypothetical protein
MSARSAAIRKIQLVTLANDMAARISRLSEERREVLLILLDGAEIRDAEERAKRPMAPVIKLLASP